MMSGDAEEKQHAKKGSGMFTKNQAGRNIPEIESKSMNNG